MSFTPSENPITNPTRESYTQLRPFRFWCQKVLPLVYDDSLSYYELLCKVVDYLNKTMEDVDHMNTDIDTLYDSFQEFQEGTIRIYNELVTYVNSYFDNLDVQQEINNKLDEMVTSGELVTYLQPTIAEEVSTWLAEHIAPTSPAVDDTLTVQGAAADAMKAGNAIAPTYNPNLGYEFGDIVKYGGTIYVCINNATGAWDVTKWKAISISSEVGNNIKFGYWTAHSIMPLLNINNILSLEGYITASGTEAVNQAFVKSPYIPINAGESYSYKNLWGNANALSVVCLYDKGKTFVSNVTSTGNFQTGTVTANVDGYIRFCTRKDYIATYGSEITPYNNLKTQLIDSTLTDANKASNSKVVGDAIKSLQSTYFDIKNYILPFINEINSFTDDGHYITNTGYYQSNANYICTPKIPVKQGDEFSYVNFWGNNELVAIVALYDINQTFDSSNSVIATGNIQSGTVTVAQDGYIQFSILKTYLANCSFNVKNVGFNGFLRNSIYEMPYLKTRYQILDSLGDSITYQGYLQEYQKWQSTLKEILGFSQVYNHGVDMSTVCDVSGRNGMCTDARINALNADANVITVMGGMNDWTASMPIGDKTYTNENTSTFFGACNVMFRKLYTRFPNRRIIAFGTTFGLLKDYEYFTNKVGYINNQGLTTLDYSKAMMESASYNGIEHYNIGGNCGICDSNKTYYLLSESSGNNYVHPSATGAYRMGQYMCKYIGSD